MNLLKGFMHESSRSLLSLGLALGLTALLAWQLSAHSAESAVVIPMPAIDESATNAGPETAVFAGGCFWGVQGVFEHVKGVIKATSGYAGGSRDTAHYEAVGSGATGHAESVEIRYDPTRVTYGQLLRILFSVVHDPTQRNRQGPDRGTQYRSTIFVANDEQRTIAQAYIEQLDHAGVYASPIVTTLESGKTFYPAEAYHQDFLSLNPRNPYIVANDLPKVENLKRLFPRNYRDQPVLVNRALH